MKKSVLIIVLLLAMTSLVLAQYHDICDPTGDPDIHGVEIEGECYNCGIDEGGVGLELPQGVCPDDYGATCRPVGGDPDCTYDEEAYWSADMTTMTESVSVDLMTGTDIYLVLMDVPVPDDTLVTFSVHENRFFGGSIPDVATATVSDGMAIGTWTVTGTDLEEVNEDEYLFYFSASGDGVDMNSVDQGPGAPNRIPSLLNITTMFGGVVITECGNYTNQSECDADPVGVAPFPGIRTEGDCDFQVTYSCSWLNGTGCRTASSETYLGDNPVCEGLLRPTCVYEVADTQGSCSAGDDFFKVTYAPSPADQEGCETWTTGPIPCPAQVRLPFFGFFNIIASLSIISIIYGFFIFKRKFIK